MFSGPPTKYCSFPPSNFANICVTSVNESASCTANNNIDSAPANHQYSELSGDGENDIVPSSLDNNNMNNIVSSPTKTVHNVNNNKCDNNSVVNTYPNQSVNNLPTICVSDTSKVVKNVNNVKNVKNVTNINRRTTSIPSHNLVCVTVSNDTNNSNNTKSIIKTTNNVSSVSKSVTFKSINSESNNKVTNACCKKLKCSDSSKCKVCINNPSVKSNAKHNLVSCEMPGNNNSLRVPTT